MDFDMFDCGYSSGQAQMDLEAMIMEMESLQEFSTPQPTDVSSNSTTPSPSPPPPPQSPYPDMMSPPLLHQRYHQQQQDAPLQHDPATLQSNFAPCSDYICGGGGGDSNYFAGGAAAVREMLFQLTAMQPVYIDPEEVKPPKRRNVKISKEPQSVAARHRRERISERIRILQRMVPGGTKMDTASMLDEAVHYVKYLKTQVEALKMVVGGNGAAWSSHAAGAPPLLPPTTPPPPPYNNNQQGGFPGTGAGINMDYNNVSYSCMGGGGGGGGGDVYGCQTYDILHAQYVMSSAQMLG